MHVELYHSSRELKALARKQKEPRMAVRIRAVYLALMGHTATEIAEILGYCRRTIQNWIYAYNHQGLPGLHEATGRGQKSRLNPDQLQWLRQRIDEGPSPEDQVCVFHAGDLQRIIKERFGICYSIRSIQRLLRKLGYRYLKPRPEHPKGDPQARVAFKKKLVLCSETSKLTMLESVSKYGAKMKPGSAHNAL